MNQNTEEKLARLTEQTSKYKAFLYDCDGTLADNIEAHKQAYKEVAASYGIDLDTAIVDELAGWPTVKVAEEISKRYQVALPTTFAQEKSTVFIEKFINDTQPIAFVTEHLKQHVGKVRIAVVSGGSRSTVTKTLTVIGVLPLIELMVCAGETEHGKPYPDPFLKAAEQLGVSPKDCVVFEDGNPGVAAAEAAGMDWIRVDQF